MAKTQAQAQEPENSSPVEQEPEEYLFLYVYRMDGEEYCCLDYFQDKQEAQNYFDRMSPPHITQISLDEQPQGYTWERLIDSEKALSFYPHTQSAYNQLVKAGTLTVFPDRKPGQKKER